MAKSSEPTRASELFRFTKVRNPEPISRALPKNAARLEAKTGIPFNKELGNQSQLYTRLYELAVSKQPSVGAYLEMGKSFRDGKTYLPNVEATRKALPTTLVADLEAESPVSLQQALELGAKIGNYPNKQLSEDPNFRNDYAVAWDNLLFQCISAKPDMGQVHALSDAIRGMEFLLRIVDAREVKEFKPSYLHAIRKSYLVLPQELQPGQLDKLGATPAKTKENAPLDQFHQRKALVQDLEQLRSAGELLADWMAMELEQPAKKTIPAVTPSKAKAPATTEPAAIIPLEEAPVQVLIGKESLESIAKFAPGAEELAARIAPLIPEGKQLRYETLAARIEREQESKQKAIAALLPANSQKVTVVGKSLLIEELPNFEEMGTTVSNTTKAGAPPAENNDPCRIKTIGTGDLYRVEHKQICYRPGEIAHIENVLAGEERERKTRRLKRSEENFSEEVEKIMEEERDTQTTDRNEMETEANKTMSQEFGLDTGVNISGSYGMVDFSANLGFSMSQSSTESHSSAQRFSKEVVEKTRRKVSEKTKSSKSMTLIEEFEENNSHKLSNTTAEHQVGIYRWVDKYMKARVVNYGKRAFLQFSVPEPASYHLYNKSEAPQANFPVAKPIAPSDTAFQSYYGLAPVRSHADISPTNYALLAAIYGVSDIKPLGTLTQYMTETMPIPDRGTQNFDAKYFVAGRAIPVPLGFVASAVYLKISHGNNPQKAPVLNYWHKDNGASKSDELMIDYTNGQIAVMTVENHTLFAPGSSSLSTSTFSSSTTFTNAPTIMSGNLVRSGGISGNLNIAAKAIMPVLATVTVKLQRTMESYEQWQIETYNSIMASFNAKQRAYEKALEELKYSVRYVGGDNPGTNRATELRELKRGCLEELLNVRKTMGIPCVLRWGMYGAIAEETYNCNGQALKYPAIDNCQAISQGKDVMFFEQAFEWEHMSYIFYAYFWGRRCKWSTLYNVEDNDPLFLKFLQSGMARTVVPIRPGFEQAVMNYLNTGLVWEGQDLPIIGDPLFVDILEEIKEAYDYNEGLILDGDPRVVGIWEYKLPTNLILLQKSAQPHEEEGLPCQQKPLIE